jgi:hypothetical protein
MRKSMYKWKKRREEKKRKEKKRKRLQYNCIIISPVILHQKHNLNSQKITKVAEILRTRELTID